MSSTRHLAPVLTADREGIRLWECSRCHWRHIPFRNQRPQDPVSGLLARSAFDEHCCEDYDLRSARKGGFLARLKTLAHHLSPHFKRVR